MYIQKIIKIFLSIITVIAVCVSVAGAQGGTKQETPKQEVPKQEANKSNLDISGQFFFQWSKILQVDDAVKNDARASQFSLQRASLTFSKTIDDMWSAKLTTDTENVAGTDNTTSYKALVKYALVQGKKSFGEVDATLKFGLIDTPVVSFIDSQTDSRWIYSNYTDKSSDLLKGSKLSIDYVADLGVSFAAKIMKKVTVTIMYGNGYGYKNTVMEDRQNLGGTDPYKNYGNVLHGMVTVAPVEGVSIFTYYRNQNTNKKISDNSIIYYGIGAAYTTKLIKTGMTYSMPEKSTNNSETIIESKYSLIDSWVNINFDSVIGKPVFLYGRYAMGSAKNDNAEAAMGATYGKSTNIYGLGVGYTISKNLRLVAYYNNTEYKAQDKADRDFYIKSELKF